MVDRKTKTANSIIFVSIIISFYVWLSIRLETVFLFVIGLFFLEFIIEIGKSLGK